MQYDIQNNIYIYIYRNQKHAYSLEFQMSVFSPKMF